jgi:hypothetical protein
MAHHKSVIRKIKDVFGDRAVTLTGDSSMDQRQSAVDRFQTDESVRYFVGSIKAAGVGITLTAASYVLFAELDWTPGAMTQAEDRCHRIGQRDNVLVHHMVLDGSMDARMAQTLIRKQEIADKALDRDTGVEVAEARTEVIYLDPAETANEQKKVATRNTSREKLAKEAESITDDQVEAIHLGLQMLAGMDQDRAMMQNDMGFNRIDGDIGHSLANAGRLTKKQAALGKRLVNKYRRQLPAELVARAKGTSNGDESND